MRLASEVANSDFRMEAESLKKQAWIARIDLKFQIEEDKTRAATDGSPAQQPREDGWVVVEESDQLVPTPSRLADQDEME